MRKATSFVISVFLVTLCVSALAYGVLYQNLLLNDGQIHEINSCLNSPPNLYTIVSVRDSRSGNITTVNLVDGGDIDSIDVYDHSKFNMFGGAVGDIYNGIEGTGNAQITISGGFIGGPLSAFDNSQFIIFGTGFNYPYGLVPDASGMLIGNLENGEIIKTDFYIYDNATIMLVPEPHTLLLLSSGIFFLMRKLRKHRDS